MNYDVVCIPNQTKVCTMTAGGPASTFDAMRGDYASFFNSFEFK